MPLAITNVSFSTPVTCLQLRTSKGEQLGYHSFQKHQYYQQPVASRPPAAAVRHAKKKLSGVFYFVCHLYAHWLQILHTWKWWRTPRGVVLICSLDVKKERTFLNVTDASSSSNIAFNRKCDQEAKTKNKREHPPLPFKVLREKQSSKIFRIYVLVGTIP